MKIVYSVLLIFSFVILPLTGITIAQTRGVGVLVKDSSGEIREIQLYKGSYALVIGNSRYTNGWDSLAGVAADVVAVRDALQTNGFVVETAENLTGEEMRDRIRKFINDHGFEPENRLLIYYAGHGHTLGSSGDNRDLGYIVPVDAPNPKRDEIGFKRRAIPMDDIQNFAKRIEAKHALFLFDSCFSGKLVSRNAITIPPVIEEKAALPVRQFITAGAADQPVPDESIFRRAFVRALEGEGDRNRDGYITGTELAEYLKDNVTNYSNRTQTPQYGKINDANLDRGDFVFVAGKRTAASSVAINSPAPEKTSSDAGERGAWDLIKDSTDRTDFRMFAEAFPNGVYTDRAKTRYEELWWNSIKDSTRRANFEEFLKEFPGGKYAPAAQFAVERIKPEVTPPARPVNAANIYRVENQWGSQKSKWQDDGSWAFAGPAGEFVVALRGVSADGGKTLTGEVAYSGGQMLKFEATGTGDNNYLVKTDAAGGSVIWGIGGRNDQAVIGVDIVSADGGKTLSGLMKYSGEGDIRFRAALTSSAQPAAAENAGSTPEEQCRNMVQGKVAWNKTGNTTWDEKNLSKLCKGTKDPAKTVDCFKTQMEKRDNVKFAITVCKDPGKWGFLQEMLKNSQQ